jgi:PAP2 superfamily
MRSWFAIVSTIVLLGSGTSAMASAEAATTNNDPNALLQWNAIAMSALSTRPSAEPFLYGAFVQAAVYDAVVGIHREYAPYAFDLRPSRPASAQAAAITAAHKVLVTYQPSAQASLDASYAASLNALPDNAAKANGIAYGNDVADHLIDLRANDGRNAPVQFTQPPAPGVWRMPPAFAPMLLPWLGGVTPLMIQSATQFDPGPPPALNSAAYTADFNEVKAYGAATGSARTDAQTATAMFFSSSAFVQFYTALRDKASALHLDIVDTARLLAAVTMSMADALIGTWHAKFTYGFWRPITAINLADTDGNDATTADPNWTPLAVNPAYPDYVSGYSAATGAFTSALAEYLGTQDIDVNLISLAAPGVTRHYETATELCDDVIDARMFLGIHFRTADAKGVALGQQTAQFALTHYFARTGD